MATTALEKNSEMLEEYLEDRKVVGKVSDETLRSYRYVISRFLEWLGKGSLIELATDSQLMIDYVRHLERQGVSRRSIKQYVIVLHVFFNRLLEQGKIRAVPTEMVIGYSTPPQAEKPSMSAEVIAKLCRYRASSEFPHRDTALVQTLLHGVMLVSEAINLTVGDLIEPDFVIIRDKTGHRKREVWVGESTMRQLRKLADGRLPDAPLFESQHGGAISVRTAQRIVDRALDDCGMNMEGLGSNWVRQTVSAFVLEQGGDSLAVSRQLGHGMRRRGSTLGGGATSQAEQAPHVEEMKARIRRDFERAFRAIPPTVQKK